MQPNKKNDQVQQVKNSTSPVSKRTLNPQIISVVKNHPGILLNMMKHALPTTKKLDIQVLP